MQILVHEPSCNHSEISSVHMALIAARRTTGPNAPQQTTKCHFTTNTKSHFDFVRYVINPSAAAAAAAAASAVLQVQFESPDSSFKPYKPPPYVVANHTPGRCSMMTSSAAQPRRCCRPSSNSVEIFDDSAKQDVTRQRNKPRCRNATHR